MSGKHKLLDEMWVKQCYKPLMTGNGKHTTSKNGDDWGMVYYCFISNQLYLSLHRHIYIIYIYTYSFGAIFSITTYNIQHTHIYIYVYIYIYDSIDIISYNIYKYIILHKSVRIIII